MIDLANRIAVVTGAGRGLGRAVSIGLARQGVVVVLVARHEAQLRETADVIRTAGGQAHIFVADVSRPEAVDELHARVMSEIGTPQILINAAGVFGPIERIDEGDSSRWIETLAINTFGPYLTCRAFTPGMLERGWGRIINFSSAAAFHQPGPLNSAYATSKVALNHFTRHLAAELSGSGVTANVIHPGEVKTEMWAAIRRESQATGPSGEGFRVWAEQVGALGGDDPQKTVDLILKLLDDTSANVNGQFLWIDGGIQQPLPSW